MQAPELDSRLKTFLWLVLTLAVCAFMAKRTSTTVSIPSVFVTKASSTDFLEFDKRLHQELVERGFRPADRPSWAIENATDVERWFIGRVNGEHLHLLIEPTEAERSVRVVSHESNFWIWQFPERAKHAAARKFARELENVVSIMESQKSIRPNEPAERR